MKGPGLRDVGGNRRQRARLRDKGRSLGRKGGGLRDKGRGLGRRWKQ